MYSFNAGATIVFPPIEKLQLLHVVLCLKSFVTFSISMVFLSAQYLKSPTDFAKECAKHNNGEGQKHNFPAVKSF